MITTLTATTTERIVSALVEEEGVSWPRRTARAGTIRAALSQWSGPILRMMM